MIVDYMNCYHTHLSALGDEVRTLILNGWIPLGGVVVLDDDRSGYLQTMVKTLAFRIGDAEGG